MSQVGWQQLTSFSWIRNIFFMSCLEQHLPLPVLLPLLHHYYCYYHHCHHHHPHFYIYNDQLCNPQPQHLFFQPLEIRSVSTFHLRPTRPSRLVSVCLHRYTSSLALVVLKFLPSARSEWVTWPTRFMFCFLLPKKCGLVWHWGVVRWYVRSLNFSRGYGSQRWTKNFNLRNDMILSARLFAEYWCQGNLRTLGVEFFVVSFYIPFGWAKLGPSNHGVYAVETKLCEQWDTRPKTNMDTKNPHSWRENHVPNLYPTGPISTIFI